MSAYLPTQGLAARLPNPNNPNIEHLERFHTLSSPILSRKPRGSPRTHRHVHTTSPACYSYTSGVPGRPHLSASRPLTLTLTQPPTSACAHEKTNVMRGSECCQRPLHKTLNPRTHTQTRMLSERRMEDGDVTFNHIQLNGHHD